MPDRLVDVIDDTKCVVIHTLPVTIAVDQERNDADFERKAADAAAFVPLAPDNELANLSTQMHVSRGGQLQPFGDLHDPECGTRKGIERNIREQAYQMWQAEGQPEGQADRHWHSCRDDDLRVRAYRLWKLDGCPENQADEHWSRARDF